MDEQNKTGESGESRVSGVPIKRVIETLDAIQKIGMRIPNVGGSTIYDIAEEIVYLMAGYNLSSSHAVKTLEIATGLIESHSMLCRKEATAETMAKDITNAKVKFGTNLI